MISIPDAAARLGLSAERVRQLARSGALPAERVGSLYVLDSRDVQALAARGRRASRPLSRANARALAAALRGERVVGVRADRIHAKVAQLHASDNPAALLRQWMPNLAERRRVSVFGDLTSDPRIQIGGAADPRIPLSGKGVNCLHVPSEVLDDLYDDWAIVDDPHGDIELVIDDEVHVDLPDCLIDLALLGGDRHDWAVNQCLR